MKGVPIKFRGNHFGKIVYGDIIHEEGKPSYIERTFIYSRVKVKEFEYVYKKFEVDPDSVAQLIGYDKYGNEVYEDDVLVDWLKHRVIAGDMVFQPQRIWDEMMKTEFVVERKCQ